MKDELILEMRSLAQVLTLRDPTTLECIAGNYLNEAADTIEKLQANQAVQNKKFDGIFFSGNDVVQQIMETNKTREARGLPPL